MLLNFLCTLEVKLLLRHRPTLCESFLSSQEGGLLPTAKASQRLVVQILFYYD